MAYSKQTWDTTSYVNPTRMNHIEDGIADNSFESDSNANGYYMKFADGTMICGKTITFANVPFTSQWGSLYESDLMDLGDLPQTFYSTPTVTAHTNNSNCWLESLPVNANNKTLGLVRAVRPTSTTLNIAISVIAIGRWKA